ncbi:MATE family efflux transporter [Beijerinckia indica]|uniref:MATE family efflux transporter n=1 Tax=Beijerinckia indica TaxID=533 RepID=UPI001FCBCDFF|nr:MATE family efflux transporter [Beijerinckia indica]
MHKVTISHWAVVRLALPMTLGHLSTPLLGIADTMVIGRLGQAALLGAIATAAMLFDFAFWIFSFLRMGTAALTAQALGRGDEDEQNATLFRALILAVGLGFTLILLQVPIARIGFYLLNASPEVTRAARAYFDIRIFSAPFVFINYAAVGAFTGRGRTDIALVVQVFLNLLNIVLNVAFVYGLGMGIKGSATGTLIAEIAGASLSLFLLLRDRTSLRALSLASVFAREKFISVLKLNSDIMIRTAALMFAFAFFTAQSAKIGDVQLAANAILMNLFLTSAYFLDGFATAAEQMSGQSLGAGDASGFRASVRLTSFWCFLFAALAFMVVQTFGAFFIDIVSTNEAVRVTARQDLLLAALTPLVGCLAFELDGVFIGATWSRDMRNMMLVSLGLYLASFYALQSLRPDLGNRGLWFALLVFLSSRGLTLAWRYRTLYAQIFSLTRSTAAAPTASTSRG